MRGRVQGVNFRGKAAEVARRLGLTGRIWNRDDGAVEAMAEGDAEALAEFERWLQRGPRLARVDGVDTEPLDGAAEHQADRGFVVG